MASSSGSLARQLIVRGLCVARPAAHGDHICRQSGSHLARWRAARPVAGRGMASAVPAAGVDREGNYVWGDIPQRETAKSFTGLPEGADGATEGDSNASSGKSTGKGRTRPVRRTKGGSSKYQTELRGGLVKVETEDEHEGEYSDEQTTTYWAPERMSDEDFMAVFEAQLDRIEKSVEHMKSMNEKFEVTRTAGCLQIDLGAEYGPYKFQLDLFNQVIRFSSPRSGGLFPYNYYQRTKRWVHHLDGHDMEGLFTRDLIFQAMGCPTFT